MEPCSKLSSAVICNLTLDQNHLEDLLQNRLLNPAPRVSDSEGLGNMQQLVIDANDGRSVRTSGCITAVIPQRVIQGGQQLEET